MNTLSYINAWYNKIQIHGSSCCIVMSYINASHCISICLFPHSACPLRHKGQGSLLQRGRLCGQPSHRAESKISKWGAGTIWVWVTGERKKNSRNKKKNETYKTSSASFGFVADTKKLTHLTLWAKRTRMKPRAGTFRKHKFERSKICKIKRQKKTGEKMWKGDLWTLTQRSKKRSWNAKT